MVKYNLFHATDESCVEAILKDGFNCKESPEHWLGNGIYFYSYLDLAKWWATNPTSKFGNTIKKACILKISMELDENRVLDLRTLEGYKDCAMAFHMFSKRASLHLDSSTKHEMQKYRCSFFDWVFRVTDTDCIIGGFAHENKLYLKTMPEVAMEQLCNFCLPFVESQFCIRKGLIAPTSIQKITEWEN